jgi:hypothetical protein
MNNQLLNFHRSRYARQNKQLENYNIENCLKIEN